MSRYKHPSDDMRDFVEVDGRIKLDRPLAMLIDFGLDKPIWVPKSKATYLGSGRVKLPEWLARRKGII